MAHQDNSPATAPWITFRPEIKVLDCTIRERFRAGTHTIYIGEVQAHGIPRPEGQPLVYWNRGYRHFVGGEG